MPKPLLAGDCLNFYLMTIVTISQKYLFGLAHLEASAIHRLNVQRASWNPGREVAQL
jgi:hypothetical protein